MNEELKRFIVDELSMQHSRSDIVRAICEQGGLDWREAEKLVERVESEEAHTVARRQVPLMALLSIGSILVGLILVYLAFDYVVGYFTGYAFERMLMIHSGLAQVGAAATGIGMIVGGMIGLYRTFARYFET